MSIHLRISRGIRDHLHVRRSEWACAVILTWWGVALISPGSTFEISPTYLGLQRMASEWTWGILCTVTGSLRLAALILNGTFKDRWYSQYSPHVRCVSASLTAFIFITVVLGIVTGPTPFWPMTTALGTYSAIAWLDISNALGTAREAGWQTRENRERGRFA